MGCAKKRVSRVQPMVLMLLLQLFVLVIPRSGRARVALLGTRGGTMNR